MGCVVSKTVGPAETFAAAPTMREFTRKVEWKLMPSSDEARKKFEADGTLGKHSDPEQLELRSILEEPVAQHAIGKYAKDKKALDIFMCWIDIQEFKNIPTDNYRRSKALHIYHKYVKPSAVLQVGELTAQEREDYRVSLENSKDHPNLLTDTFYEKLQQKCFLAIFHNIYVPFKTTDEYARLKNQIKQKYNVVRISDFEYFNKLGEGGFGFVVHCRKKSTGKHYAMKLQTKKGLLDCFQDDPWRADFEKQAFAACQHPFIVNLDYAFQTDTLAIMVLGLATAGDLQKALQRSPDDRLPEERVRFYVAEIVLALSYLHQMGLMYRDLKPNNILLNEDGHIQLVDLGGVADEHGTTLGKHNEAHDLLPLFAQNFAAKKDAPEEPKEIVEVNGKRKKTKRKLSIMGTFGYMAPEMVIMLSQHSHEKTGYTFAIDWWSLGVTMFKLLTGFRPFTDDNFHAFVEMATTMNNKVRAHSDCPEYAILFQQISYPSYLSPNAVHLISRLLDVNDKTRLGAGPTGSQDIKAHPFFEGLDWDLLEQKHIEPPFKPDRSKLFDEVVAYPDFESLLKEFGKSDMLEDPPAKEDQKYFAHWDFISANTIRIEAGLSYEMDQFDRNFKVRQLMGEKQKNISGAKGTNTAALEKKSSVAVM